MNAGNADLNENKRHRIVSLIPSATEIVCALGFERQLVGRSHECDFPESVKRLPVVTEPKFNPEGSSYEIDQRVQAIVKEALSVYRVHADGLKRLRPDVIITQSQCEVCAVSLKDVEQAVRDWLDESTQIVSLSPGALSDVWFDMVRVAQALDVPERGDDLVGRLKNRILEISRRVGLLPERPTVACIEWIEPLMAAGNWVPELVEMAGGVNLFGEAGAHSPWMEWKELVQHDPDVIVVLPCGFEIRRSRENISALTKRPEWSRLGAVRERRVYLVDGNQYFNRPGPRLVESLEILAELLHPGRINFGHAGLGWERLHD